MKMETCKICGCDFDLDGEGGASFCVGILPCYSFCSTCFNGIKEVCEPIYYECPHCGEDIYQEEN